MNSSNIMKSAKEWNESLRIVLSVEKPSDELVSYCIDNGADPNNAVGNDGSILLQAIIKKMLPETIFHLLKAGANPNVGNLNLSPLAAASYYKSLEDSALITEILILHGANINLSFA